MELVERGIIMDGNIVTEIRISITDDEEYKDLEKVLRAGVEVAQQSVDKFYKVSKAENELLFRIHAKKHPEVLDGPHMIII